MEPFRGKASGKTPDAMDGLDIMLDGIRAFAETQQERIAELEAELAVERGARDDFKRAWEGEKKWREEAEAEVERLQRRIAELERLLTLSSSPLTHQGEPGVNPSGELSLSARKATPKTCEFCGQPEHAEDSECPAWNYEGKERDDG